MPFVAPTFTCRSASRLRRCRCRHWSPGDSDAPGELFALPRERARDTRRLSRAPDARGRDRSDRCGAHGVHQAVQSLRGHRRSALAACRTCGGQGVETRSETTSGVVPRGSATACTSMWQARETPVFEAATGGPDRRRSVDPHPLFRSGGRRSPRGRSSRDSRSGAGRKSKFPPRRARPGCEYQPAPSPASDSVSRERGLPSPPRRPVAETWLSRCAWCCRDSSTSVRRSCSASSGELHPERRAARGARGR